jgi:hypothetical protein
MDNERDDRSLESCREEVRRLEEENRRLRDSAKTFGDLAERLNTALERERRGGGDRRATARPGQERRHPSASE